MNEKDRKRHEELNNALTKAGVEVYLLVGLRKSKEHGPDEAESFYAMNAGDKSLLVAALRNVFAKNLELAELLICLLHEVVHTQARTLGVIGDSQEAADA